MFLLLLYSQTLINNYNMASKKQNSGRRPKPMVPKVGVKPKSMGGGRYGCGGKLK